MSKWWTNKASLEDQVLLNKFDENQAPLFDMAQKFLSTFYEESRPSSSWNVSGLGSLCPRALAFEVLTGEPRQEKVDARSRLRMDIGTAIHRLLQDNYLSRSGMLFGTWVCDSCGGSVENSLNPGKHEGCGTYEYRETRISYKESHWTRPLVGKPDAELVVSNYHEPYVLEIKTTTGKIPTQLSEVNPDYVLQLQTYLWLRKRSRGAFLFVDQTFGLKQGALPIQWIQVFYDPTTPERVISIVNQAEEALAQAILHSLEHKAGKGSVDFSWPVRVCPDRNCFTAQRCPYASRCFDEVWLNRAKIRLERGESLDGLDK